MPESPVSRSHAYDVPLDPEHPYAHLFNRDERDEAVRRALSSASA